MTGGVNGRSDNRVAEGSAKKEAGEEDKGMTIAMKSKIADSSSSKENLNSSSGKLREINGSLAPKSISEN